MKWKIGDWVSATSLGSKYAGYISETNEKTTVIDVVHPSRFQKTTDTNYLIRIPSSIETADIPDLIKLALQTKDKEWFHHLIELQKFAEQT